MRPETGEPRLRFPAPRRQHDDQEHDGGRDDGDRDDRDADGARVRRGGPSRAAHTPPAKAEAYGKYCQGQSKKHVKGQKGTPFSQCVAAMRKLDAGTATNPAKACATESRKHVAGQKGTPYSDCVSAGAKLLADPEEGSGRELTREGVGRPARCGAGARRTVTVDGRLRRIVGPAPGDPGPAGASRCRRTAGTGCASSSLTALAAATAGCGTASRTPGRLTAGGRLDTGRRCCARPGRSAWARAFTRPLADR